MEVDSSASPIEKVVEMTLGAVSKILKEVVGHLAAVSFEEEVMPVPEEPFEVA